MKLVPKEGKELGFTLFGEYFREEKIRINYLLSDLMKSMLVILVGQTYITCCLSVVLGKTKTSFRPVCPLKRSRFQHGIRQWPDRNRDRTKAKLLICLIMRNFRRGKVITIQDSYIRRCGLRKLWFSLHLLYTEAL